MAFATADGKAIATRGRSYGGSDFSRESVARSGFGYSKPLLNRALPFTVCTNCRDTLFWPPLAVPPLSVTVTVMVALPCCPATGV